MAVTPAFRRLATGLDVAPVCAALDHQPDLWNTCRLRTGFPGSPHAQADDILLRFQALQPFVETQNPACLIDEEAVEWWPAWEVLSDDVGPLIRTVCEGTQAVYLGRVIITRLAGGGYIPAHVNEGRYAESVARCQVVLAGTGTRFRAGTARVVMAPGECWWFDTSQEHAVYNDAMVPRVTLIVDVRVGTGGRYVA